ncbi:MAG: phytoene desaturase family protein, partial [Planctomycetota bacterium]
MSDRSYDSIVIGGGHNGLVCAAYLARAGQKVLVLERRHVLGGAAVTEELYPGFKYSVCSYVVSLLRPEIIRDLSLPKYGLEILPLECSFTPELDGPGLVRWPDADKTRREIARLSKRDSEVYPNFGREMVKVGRMVKPILEMVPPDPTSLNPANLMEMLKLGRLFGRLSEAERILQAKMFTMSAIDFLDEWFESDLLKATMGVSGIIGTFQGVRSPGTAYVLMHHYMGEIDGAFRAWGLSKGGTGMISQSIADSAQSFGAEIRTEAGVSQIMVRAGRAKGVVLEDGTEITAKHVVS